jgi:hypothetical protein
MTTPAAIPLPWPLAPDDPVIEVAPETSIVVTDVPVKESAIPDEAPRPTLPRPTPGATGLFQGWGPRLR